MRMRRVDAMLHHDRQRRTGVQVMGSFTLVCLCAVQPPEVALPWANPPPLASSVPFLASRGVELQLIAHFLPAVDLLRLTRCSRTTLAALSDEYAWRFVHPPLHSVTSPNLPSLVAKSLLRFCGISVRLDSSLPLDAVWRPFLPAVDALLPFPFAVC